MPPVPQHVSIIATDLMQMAVLSGETGNQLRWYILTPAILALDVAVGQRLLEALGINNQHRAWRRPNARPGAANGCPGTGRECQPQPGRGQRQAVVYKLSGPRTPDGNQSTTAAPWEAK